MFPVRLTVRRGVPVVVSAVALAALTAACGSSANSAGKPARIAAAATGRASAAAVSTGSARAARQSPASARGVEASVSPASAGRAALTGSAASALVRKAVANTQAASSVQVAGQAAVAGTRKGSSAQPVTFDMTIVKHTGCEGTMATSKTSEFRIVQTGGYLWLLPNSAFYASLHLSKPVQAQVTGKYLKLKTGSSQIGDLAEVCTLSNLLGAISAPTADFTATSVSYDGVPAYQVTKRGQPVVAYISRASQPLLLRLTGSRSTAGIAFTGYDVATSITPPAAADTVAGGKIGA